MRTEYLNGPQQTVPYTASGAAVAVDDVVVLGGVSGKKASVGIAMKNVADGETVDGAILVSGRVRLPKVSGAVIVAGQAVNWDADAGGVDDNAATPASGDVVEFGKALTDGGNGDVWIEVELLETGIFT